MLTSHSAPGRQGSLSQTAGWKDLQGLPVAHLSRQLSQSPPHQLTQWPPTQPHFSAYFFYLQGTRSRPRHLSPFLWLPVRARGALLSLHAFATSYTPDPLCFLFFVTIQLLSGTFSRRFPSGATPCTSTRDTSFHGVYHTLNLP